jgi:hypothetical protein
MINLIDGYFMSESGDGGDSARAHGIVDLFGNLTFGWKNHNVIRFMVPAADSTQLKPTYTGLVMRHPTQAPWNNPWNFSRDQLICWASGMWSLNYTDELKLVIDRLKARNWFCFNDDRDYPGTRKHPYPHKMTGGDPVDEGKWRLFDYADPLLPHHILHLYNCAKIEAPEHIKNLGDCLLSLSIKNNSQKINNEQNQLQCMVKVAGPKWVDHYIEYNPNWEAQTKYYWLEQRNCPEFYDLIINEFPNPKDSEGDS